MHDANARVISVYVDYYNDAINTLFQRGSADVSNYFSISTGFTEYGYNTDAFTIASVLYLTNSHWNIKNIYIRHREHPVKQAENH